MSAKPNIIISQLSVKSFLVGLVALSFIATFVYAVYQTRLSQSALTGQNKLQESLAESTYREHLIALEKLKLQEVNRELLTDASKERLAKIDALYAQYQDVVGKIKRNFSVKLDVTEVSSLESIWGSLFLSQSFESLQASLTDAASKLDASYQIYLAGLPKPVATPSPTSQAGSAYGYSFQTVTNSRGTFGVYFIKMSLNEVTVKTVSANENDCLNNCPVKPLAQYISDLGGYAGINGTYFCPPDYSSCAGKTNSYDFPVYNSDLSRWLNQGALSWTSIGLATFSGKTPRFYRYNNLYDKSSVTASISNFPLLLQNGAVIDSESEQTSNQKIKGTRGSIGSDGVYIYLALVVSSSVTDSAYVLQQLGVKDALNLDGGGSSALYVSGSYKVGPGRQLPNAVVLIKN